MAELLKTTVLPSGQPWRHEMKKMRDAVAEHGASETLAMVYARTEFEAAAD